MVTYEQITKNHTLTQIAIALGFCTEKSSFKRQRGAATRVANWKRTGIPKRVIEKKGEELKKLVGEQELS